VTKKIRKDQKILCDRVPYLIKKNQGSLFKVIKKTILNLTSSGTREKIISTPFRSLSIIVYEEYFYDYYIKVLCFTLFQIMSICPHNVQSQYYKTSSEAVQHNASEAAAGEISIT